MQAVEAARATVTSMMTAPVRTLTAETTAMEALRVAEELDVHHFPVMQGERLLGVVCTCDLEDVELTAPVKSAIRRAAVCVDCHAEWPEAVQRMRSELVGSVIVMQDGKAIGILTREDVSRAGIDVTDTPNFHCDSCGSVTHLKREGKKGILCLDCRSHSNPETPADAVETGTVD